MGKYIYALATVFIIEFLLWLFGGTSYANTSIFSILTDPSALLSNPIYIAIGVALVAFAGSTVIPIVAGTSLQLNVYALYSGLAVIFLSFSMSIAHLWTFISGEISGALCGVGVICNPALYITVPIIFPIFLFYLISTIEWVRGT